ncbi:MAG: hypothetical protein JWM68_3440 [Verrucomicrobiales bacterium]|nr:hypothetical protein [Verrucomicrobiales bacterium]
MEKSNQNETIYYANKIYKNRASIEHTEVGQESEALGRHDWSWLMLRFSGGTAWTSRMRFASSPSWIGFSQGNHPSNLIMKAIKRSREKIGLILFGAVAGCTTYVEQPQPRQAYIPPPTPVYVQPAPVYVAPPPVYVAPPPSIQVEASIGSVGVVIRTESDFYEPLSDYGRWEIVGSYGRCWIPNRVDREWRPYCNGNWERTDAGWYWASDEPWGWATYHYGRWDVSPQFGWYWVPQTQWSPAWVSWHEGGGYVGWAPLQPSARMSSGGSITVNVALIAPRAFVFVEPKRFMQPVRPTTVVVNNTTIVNKTVNITNIKIVNNTVINEGPRTQVIEQASGQQIRPVAVRELRRKHEAEVVVRQQAALPGHEKKEKNIPTVHSESGPRVLKAQSEVQRRQEEISTQEQLKRNIEESKRANQLEAQRRANEANAKAQQEARSKESQRLAEMTAQERAADLAAREQLERNTQERKRANQLEAQRQANEARGKAQEEASKLKASARIPEGKLQPHGNELEKKAQSKPDAEAKVLDNQSRPEPHGKGSEKVHGNSDGRPKLEQVPQEQGKTNLVNKPPKNKGKGRPGKPVLVPTSENSLDKKQQ